MTFVLPQFKPMFDQMETLPFLTQLLFDISDFVGANWPVLIVVVLLLILGGRILLAQPKVRRQWDRFILHAPVVGVLNRKICTARFASTLSNLYGSGVPIITTSVSYTHLSRAPAIRWPGPRSSAPCRC